MAVVGRFEAAATALRSLLKLSAPPVVIGFHSTPPDGVELFDRPMPVPTTDGRTGRVPAGCVFWMHGTERTFATVAADHSNCSVGSYTHGFQPLEEVARHGDVAELVSAGWVAEADLWKIPTVSDRPGSVTYGPLATADSGDVVLMRLNSAGLMTLLDAWPELLIEGKPQCHIVALAKQHGRIAASVGCALSRARTGMPATESTAAVPMSLVDPLIARLRTTAEANTAVARYAGTDAARFEDTR